ncbi:MAG: tetratricopeptide repeat protein [Candidatus Zixiibacteriota bacterium]|nr:MAG: tetratricopeptide repeat protein [candidate division Zixibacteria bacterium]
MAKKEVYLIIGIFIFALAVRLVYLDQMKSSPMFDTLIMDSEYHDQWARMILQGEDFGEGAFFRAPLYAYFLASVYKIFGPGHFQVRLIQLMLGAISCVLVYLLGKRVFNRRIAVIAALLASLNGVMVYFEGELLIPVLLVLLDLLLLLALFWAKERPSYPRWLACGAILGLSALARPNILLVGAAVFLWVILRFRGKASGRSKSVAYACIFAAGAALVISPVTLRNYVKANDLVLIAWQGGMNFYIGNNSQSDGTSATIPGARTTWWGSYGDAKIIAEETMGRSLKPSEQSRFWYVEGLKFVYYEPLNYLRLMLKKFTLFWNGNELGNNRDLYFFTRSSSVLRLLLWRFSIYFPFGLIAPLALVGIILAYQAKKDVLLLEIFLFVYMLSVILFFVNARYRVPIIPVLILFSAFALDWFISWVGERKYPQVGKYVLILLVFLIPINLSMPKYRTANLAHAHYTMGVLHTKKGDEMTAIKEFQKALEYNPYLSEAYVNLGALHGDLGKHRLALKYFQEALENGADSAFILSNMGYAHYSLGVLNQAERDYKLSLSLRADPEVHYLLGDLYFRKGMLEDAADEFEKAIRLDPQHALASYRLAEIYRQMGEKERQ